MDFRSGKIQHSHFRSFLVPTFCDVLPSQSFLPTFWSNNFPRPSPHLDTPLQLPRIHCIIRVSLSNEDAISKTINTRNRHIETSCVRWIRRVRIANCGARLNLRLVPSQNNRRHYLSQQLEQKLQGAQGASGSTPISIPTQAGWPSTQQGLHKTPPPNSISATPHQASSWP